jgi:hypothetical protein
MTLKASCHCRATQFTVETAPIELASCNCSFCAKRGALWAYYTPAQFKLITAPDRVSTYQWGSYTVKHHYCAICGCGTFSESPDWSKGEPDFDNPRVGVNARLFDGFDLEPLPVRKMDGKAY